MTERAIEAALAARFGLGTRGSSAVELRAIVCEVAARRGIVGADAALRAVLGDDALLREIAERLTVGESHFYRHPEQLEAVVSHLVELVARPRDVVTVWSAGCSRGEEPYTLAMMLERRLGATALGSIRIVGTDLHAGAIAQAREGRYLPWSFRGTSAADRARDFDVVPGGFRIAARFRDRVELVHAAIQEHAESFADESIDVVLFRNVGIYLTPEALDRFFRVLTSKLRRGGLLVLSATDPQPALETLLRASEHGASVYRRAGGTIERRVAASPRAPAAQRSQLSQRSRSPSSGSASDAVREARALADDGRLDEALHVLDRIDSRSADACDAWSVRGQIHLTARRYEQAAIAFERARALAPRDPALRFFAAISLRKLGRAALARSLFESLEAELERATDRSDRAVAGGLLEGVRAELARMR